MNNTAKMYSTQLLHINICYRGNFLVTENLLRECVPFEFIAKCTELPLAVVKALNQQLQRDYQFNTDFVPFSGVCVS